MRYVGSLAVAIAALGLTLLAAPVQAAPAGGPVGGLKTAAGDGTPVEQVRHRCYWHRGHWHCPRHRYYHYNSPGFHFHFGPRRHHHHRHHWRHHRHRH